MLCQNSSSCIKSPFLLSGLQFLRLLTPSPPHPHFFALLIWDQSTFCFLHEAAESAVGWAESARWNFSTNLVAWIISFLLCFITAATWSLSRDVFLPHSCGDASTILIIQTFPAAFVYLTVCRITYETWILDPESFKTVSMQRIVNNICFPIQIKLDLLSPD